MRPVCSHLALACWPRHKQPGSQHRGDTASYFYSTSIEFRSWKPKSQSQVSQVIFNNLQEGSLRTLVIYGHSWEYLMKGAQQSLSFSIVFCCLMVVVSLAGFFSMGFFFLFITHSIFSKTFSFSCNNAEPRYPQSYLALHPVLSTHRRNWPCWEMTHAI